MRTSLAWLLESVGVKSAGFANAERVSRAFDAAVPACLVLDVRMPEQSGFDVQAELNRRGATLPIIFVSGHGDIPMSVRALQNGAIDFVEKPYNSQQMLDRVQRALKLAAQRHVADQKQRELRKRIESLTAREKEVLRGVIDGKGSKRIAERSVDQREDRRRASREHQGQARRGIDRDAGARGDGGVGRGWSARRAVQTQRALR